MTILHDLNDEELAVFVAKMGLPKFRAKQLRSHLTKFDDFDDMSDLPKELIAKLKQVAVARPIKENSRFESKDGSCKFLFELQDGNLIESVYLPHGYGNSVCVSTQVGCAMGCVFCASGAYGRVRNLSAGEILSQVLFINRKYSQGSRAVSSVVMMGSGSPLDNYDNSLKFIRLINDGNGLNLGMRSISLSTCGLPDKIKKLADDGFTGTLSLSLHAPNDDKRRQIMKIANAYSIERVIDAVKYFFDKTARRVVFEYALIEGFNDTDADAKELAALTRGFACHVNLIRLNKVDNCELCGSSMQRAKEFNALLEKLGVSSTLRRSMGSDVAGACGQLKNRTVLKANTEKKK